MNTSSNYTKVEKDLVVGMDYSLKVDGEIVDSSEGSEPIEFIQGHGNIIPGLEKELYGLKIGESKKVLVKASEGYGEYDPDAILTVDKQNFPDEIPLEIGIEVAITNDDGNEMIAVIEEIGENTITLNGNHPLAGKDLEFDVRIASLREPTAEEIEHGHVHGDEDCCCCGDEECDCEDEDCCDCK